MVESRRVRLRLALPWLGDALRNAAPGGHAPARAPAGEWLVARGRRVASDEPSWRRWLLEGTGRGEELLRRFPAGPCVRASSTGDRPGGVWACARPVHLLTAIDHLQLAPEALAIDAAESSALLADVNRHLAGRGFALHEPGTGGEWLLECAEPIDCTCVEPEGATGRNLRDLMPGGRDGPRIRALINEMQMLLHEHPVNAGRAARGAPAVNSVWLWGFGGVGDVPALPLPVLYTDDPWLEGMWRLHGAPSRTLVEFAADVTRADRSVLLGWSRDPSGAAAVALAAAESRCFAPVRTALQGSAIEAVAMLLGDRAIVTDRSARVRFWRRPQPLQEALW